MSTAEKVEPGAENVWASDGTSERNAVEPDQGEPTWYSPIHYLQISDIKPYLLFSVNKDYISALLFPRCLWG